MSREPGPQSRIRPSGNCPNCGTFRRRLHKDHTVPTWKGGSDTPDNWQFICANCHEDKTSEDMKGRRHTSEILAQILLSRGDYKPLTIEHKERIRQANLGRTHTPEAKEKIRAARIVYWTPERRSAMSLKQKERAQ